MNRSKNYRDTQKFYYGYCFCEMQGVGKCYGPLEIHHIIFRSAIPGHKETNNPKNLVCLCRKHHQAHHGNDRNYPHSRKELQSYRVRERNLYLLFPEYLNDRYKEDTHQYFPVRPQKIGQSH